MVGTDAAAQSKPLASYAPPPGFAILRDEADGFVKERARRIEHVPLHLLGSQSEERAHRYDSACQLVMKALGGGHLVVFIDQTDGTIAEVPPPWWLTGRTYQDVRIGAHPDDPMDVHFGNTRITGVALVDKTNFDRFARFAGHWPPFRVPPVVSLLLDVCADLDEMGKGFPVQKADAIVLLRLHWPSELEAIWPKEQRLSSTANPGKDGCPDRVSDIAELLWLPDKWEGRYPTRMPGSRPRAASLATPAWHPAKRSLTNSTS